MTRTLAYGSSEPRTPSAFSAAPPGGPLDPRVADATDLLEKGSRLRVRGAVTPRLMGHLFSIGDSAALEGSLLKHTTVEMCQALGWLAESIHDGPTLALVHDVTAQLQRAGTWATALTDALVRNKARSGGISGAPPAALAHAIAAALREDGRVVIPASVRGYDDSHATLVEAVVQADGRYTLRIFNTNVDDPRQFGLPGTYLQASHTDFIDIPARAMLRPQYIHGLLGLAFVSRRPLDVGMKALYDWAARHGTLAPSAAPLQASQSVGNCAWKCVARYVRDRLPRHHYMRLKLEHRTRVLDEYAHGVGTPVLVTQMVAWYGAGYAWHIANGHAMPIPVWGPVAYGQVPVGWMRAPAPAEAEILALSRRQLSKTQQRYTLSLLNAHDEGVAFGLGKPATVASYRPR